MKIPLSKRTLFATELSDSEKVTLLMHEADPSATPESLAKSRGLPEQLVRQHLDAAKKLKTSAQREESVMSLLTYYVTAYKDRFRMWRDQPNLRAAITQVVRELGADKTRVVLKAWFEGCKTADDARIVNFYKMFGPKPKKNASKAAR